jgi:hypothetical protein
MSSMKGIAYWVITMHKLGTPVDVIQTMLDNADIRDSKQAVANLVVGFINGITQQQVAQSTRQGEEV